MILRARGVLTMDGAPIENGAVAVDGNKIIAVGSWPEIKEGIAGGDVIDLGERVLLPGLINAHCHLDYTTLRGAIPAPASFSAWIKSINQEKASLAPEDYIHSIEAGLAEAADFGTTTIANLEAFPELISQVKSAPLRIWWFAEMIDVRAPVVAADVYEKLCETLRGSELGSAGLAPHAPFTASGKLYQETSALAAAMKIPVTTHLAESTEEMEMFRDGNGALFDLMKGIGRPMQDCGHTTPLALMLEHGLLDERWIVAHLNELTLHDFKVLERAPHFHIAHCPRSHAYFGHSPFALQKLRALDFEICLATDSLASNQDLSLFSEMRQFWKTEPALRADEILKMATVNPAAALGQSERLGRIRTGHLADLLAVPFTRAIEEIADEIIAFSGTVPWLMVNGRERRAANE